MNESYNYQQHGPVPVWTGEEYLLAGRYCLKERIGLGGVAEVFRAVDERLDRMVAVKIMRPEYTADEQARRRFIIEAKAAAGLSHPNVVDVYDYGQTPDGKLFIAMQYVDGQSLEALLRRRGKLPGDEVIALVSPLCMGLAAAHAHGLIHRDVKPGNILVDERGNVRLTDFGIVKAAAMTALTQAGFTFGTAAYLSPEQATGAPVSPASDVYALGCVMYEMLSGAPPFDGDNPAAVTYKQVWEQPTPLREREPNVPIALEKVVMRCLAKDPHLRYPDTRALALALGEVSMGLNRPTESMTLVGVVPPEEEEAPPASHSVAPVQRHITPVHAAPAVPIAVAAVHVPQVRALTAPLPAAEPEGAPLRAYLGTVSTSETRVRARKRNMVVLAATAAIVVILSGLLFWQVRGSAGSAEGPVAPDPKGNAAALAPPPEPSPTSALGLIVVEQPSPTPLPTETAVPPTPELPTPEPPTPEPQPVVAIAPVEEVPTATPEPPPPPPVPTDTPAPPPTDTPEPPPPPPPPPEDTPVPAPPEPQPVPPTETPTALQQAVTEAIQGNPDLVQDHFEGKKSALPKLVKEVRDRLTEKINPLEIIREIQRKVEELRQS